MRWASIFLLSLCFCVLKLHSNQYTPADQPGGRPALVAAHTLPAAFQIFADRNHFRDTAADTRLLADLAASPENELLDDSEVEDEDRDQYLPVKKTNGSGHLLTALFLPAALSPYCNTALYSLPVNKPFRYTHTPAFIVHRVIRI
jgi:hypothetical protein